MITPNESKSEEENMSRADELYKQTCRKILEEGFSDEGLDVRPKWADGTPAHTIKTFGVVNR